MAGGETVAIVDYGMGNLHSVAKAVERVSEGRAAVEITGEPARIAAADRVVFPGQGAVRDCMGAIVDRGLDAPVRAAAESKPFLGICMGLQVLFERSAEHADTPCLGILAGEVLALPRRDEAGPLTIPQMGWNQVRQTHDHPMWAGIADGERFYFANSYYVAPADEGSVTGRTRYGVDFASAVGHRNLFATQFHPEKSATAGLRLLANFLAWTPGRSA